MDVASQTKIQCELQPTLRRAEELRKELQTLMEPATSSCVRLFETRKRRQQLESRLESKLRHLGALVLDRYAAGGDLSSLNESSKHHEDPFADAAKDSAPTTSSPPSEPESSDAHEAASPIDFAELFAASEAAASAGDDVAPEAQSRPSASTATDTEDTASHHPRNHRQIADIFPDVKEMLGTPPATSDDYADLMGELSVLKRATRSSKLERWRLLPDEVQVCLGSMIAVRVRHLQSEIAPSLAGTVITEQEARDIFRRLSCHMEKYRPSSSTSAPGPSPAMNKRPLDRPELFASTNSAGLRAMAVQVFSLYRQSASKAA